MEFQTEFVSGWEMVSASQGNKGFPRQRGQYGSKCLMLVFYVATAGWRGQHFCRVRKRFSTTPPDFTPNMGIIVPYSGS